jgi:hypothetical protein
MVLGLGFIVLTRALLQHEEHPVVFASMGGLDVRKALLLIVGIITLHVFTDGGRSPGLIRRTGLWALHQARDSTVDYYPS